MPEPRYYLVLALVFFSVQHVHAHGLREEPPIVETDGYSVELVPDPKYPVAWKKTTLRITILKDGLPLDGGEVTLHLRLPQGEEEIVIDTTLLGDGVYEGRAVLRKAGTYQVLVKFDGGEAEFSLKVDSLGIKGMLRGMFVLFVIAALVRGAAKSCRGDRDA